MSQFVHGQPFTPEFTHGGPLPVHGGVLFPVHGSPNTGGSPPAPTLLALNTPIVMVNNSKGADIFSYSMAGYFQALTGGRYYGGPWWRLAKGGDWVRDYVQRMDLALAQAAGGLMWLGDATNSVGKTWTAGDGTAETPAKIIAQYRAMCTTWTATGGYVIIELTARTTSMGAGGSTDLDRQSVNTQLVAMAAEAGWGGKVKIADLSTLDTSDTTLFRDGTHYTAKGALTATTIIAAVASALITTDPVIPASGDLAATVDGKFGANKNTLYPMIDVSPVDGTADSAVITAASGATLTRSFVTESSKRKQLMTFSGSASSSATDVYQLTANGAGLNGIAGSVWEMLAPFEVADAANVTDPTNLPGFQYGIGLSTQFGATIQAAALGLPKFAGMARIAALLTGATVTSLAATFGARPAVGAVGAALRMGDGWFVRQCEVLAYSTPVNQGITRNRPSDASSSNFFLNPVASGTTTLAVTSGQVSGGAIVPSYLWKKDGGAPGATATNRTYVRVGGTETGVFTCDVTHTNSFGFVTITSSSLTF